MTLTQEVIYIGLLVLGILATFATAGLLLWLCSFSRFAPLFRSLTNLSPQVVAIVGILFALYTTFFASDIWNIRDRAQTAIQQEAEAMRGLFRLAEQQPPAIGAPIIAALREYARATIQDEWPLLARGEPPSGQTLERWRTCCEQCWRNRRRRVCPPASTPPWCRRRSGCMSRAISGWPKASATAIR